MSDHLAAFRLGDIRGVYPTDINADFALRFAHAFTEHFALKGKVAVGRDMRTSSVILQEGLLEGFTASGLDVVDLGLCTTELGYFASSKTDIAAAIVVTASHNPAEYNGFKCVLHGGAGIHFGNGLGDVMRLMLSGHRNRVAHRGVVVTEDFRRRYVEFLRPRFSIQAGFGTIALNGLNGTASTLAADIADEFELPTRWFRREPGPFPQEGADPVKPQLRQQMFEFMQSTDFDLGVAWDGDCDRCVFFDGAGQYIPSYYMVGILADHILSQTGPAPVVFDTKIFWNLAEVLVRHGATPVPSKTGHSFMKQHMKRSAAVYGGELSSHHYFRDFFACDSGMYAWLKVVELISLLDTPLAEIVEVRRRQFKCTPELSLRLDNVDEALAALTKQYSRTATGFEQDDGIAFNMGQWRFSVRESKTEPLVRVNLETSASGDELLEHGSELLKALQPFSRDDTDWLSQLNIE